MTSIQPGRDKARILELLAELERRDRDRATAFRWWCRGWLAGYRAGRVRVRQAP